MILKRMKRRHSRADTIAFTARARALRPDAAFGADLIAGFPTETDGMFANTLALIDDADLSVLHVFPFSPRKGTPAQRMPQVDRALIKDRAARLREKGHARFAQRLAAMIGRDETVLVEKPGFGRTACFAPVSFEGELTAGSFARMRVTGAASDHLIAA